MRVSSTDDARRHFVLFMIKDDESEFRGNMNLSDDQSVYRGSMILESTGVFITQTHPNSMDSACDKDEIGAYAEICFTSEMSPVILEENDYGKLKDDEVAIIVLFKNDW